MSIAGDVLMSSESSLTRSDRRKLSALRSERYFTGQLGKRTLEVAVSCLRQVARPEWLCAWLTDPNPDTDTLDAEEIDLVRDSDTHCIFDLLGRSADMHDGYNEPRVLAAWLRMGLDAPVKAVAGFCDRSEGHTSRVKAKWLYELRMLLQDAFTLGVSGVDLYLSTSTSGYEPARLLTKLQALRRERNESSVALPLETQAHEVEAAWFDHRVKWGYRGQSPDTFAVEPPRWFVKEILDTEHIGPRFTNQPMEMIQE